MEIPTQYIPMIGTISAAIIVGITTFVVSVLSKEQKTSEFRQAWIDGLRNDISEFTGRSSSIVFAIVSRMKLNPSKEEIKQYVFEKEVDVIILNSLLDRIKLRLNPKEHERLIGFLEDAESTLSKYEDEFEKNIN